jgi:hypothetical protein
MICDSLHLTHANIQSKWAQIIPVIKQAAHYKSPLYWIAGVNNGEETTGLQLQ